MHDPNRKRDRGDPNVDNDPQAEVVWDRENADANDRSADVSTDVRDAESSAFGSPAWSGSNPGTTGDEPTNTGGSAEAGSGVRDENP